jgi:hypothetical protein
LNAALSYLFVPVLSARKAKITLLFDRHFYSVANYQAALGSPTFSFSISHTEIFGHNSLLNLIDKHD